MRTYEEEVRAEAEEIRAGGGPPIQAIRHERGECSICDALRLIDEDQTEEKGP